MQTAKTAQKLADEAISSIEKQLKEMEKIQGFSVEQAYLKLATHYSDTDHHKTLYVHVIPLIGRNQGFFQQSFAATQSATEEAIPLIRERLKHLSLIPYEEIVEPALAKHFAKQITQKLAHDYPDIFTSATDNSTHKGTFTIATFIPSDKKIKNSEVLINIRPYVSETEKATFLQPTGISVSVSPNTGSHEKSEQFAEQLKTALEKEDYLYSKTATLSPNKAAVLLIPLAWLRDKPLLRGNEHIGYRALLTIGKDLESRDVVISLGTRDTDIAKALIEEKLVPYIAEQKATQTPFSISSLREAVLPRKKLVPNKGQRIDPIIINAKDEKGHLHEFLKLMTPGDAINHTTAIIRVAPTGYARVVPTLRTITMFPSEIPSAEEAAQRIKTYQKLALITISNLVEATENPQLMLKMRTGKFEAAGIDNVVPRSFTWEQLVEKTVALLSQDRKDWKEADAELVKFASNLKQSTEALQFSLSLEKHAFSQQLSEAAHNLARQIVQQEKENRAASSPQKIPFAEQVTKAFTALTANTSSDHTLLLAVADAMEQFQKDAPYYDWQMEGSDPIGYRFKKEQYFTSGYLQEMLADIEPRARALSFRTDVSPRGEDENGPQLITVQAMHNFRPAEPDNTATEKGIWVGRYQQEINTILPWNEPLQFFVPSKADAEAFEHAIAAHLLSNPLTGVDRPVKVFGEKSMNLVLNAAIKHGLDTLSSIRINPDCNEAFVKVYTLPEHKSHGGGHVQKSFKSPGTPSGMHL